jgi:epoxide hydrolase-like predicted phosphatase
VVKRAVVFDIGGVLELNPRTGWPARWAARIGIDMNEFDRRLTPIWNAGSIGTSTLAEIERQTAIALALDRPALAELMEDAWHEYVGSLNAPLAEYFTSLRPCHRTAMLSNSFVGAREREQQLYGFEEMCDVIVYSHEVGCLKPNSRIYELTCRRLGVSPGEAIFVDDVQENVDAARAVGMSTIRFVDNRQTIEQVEEEL